MPFKKGEIHIQGGRKSRYEELQVALKDAKERITQEALIELANSKVFEFLQKAVNHSEVKDLGLPITLKGMLERQEVSGEITIKSVNYGDRDNATTQLPATPIPTATP